MSGGGRAPLTQWLPPARASSSSALSVGARCRRCPRIRKGLLPCFASKECPLLPPLSPAALKTELKAAHEKIPPLQSSFAVTQVTSWSRSCLPFLFWNGFVQEDATFELQFKLSFSFHIKEDFIDLLNRLDSYMNRKPVDKEAWKKLCY